MDFFINKRKSSNQETEVSIYRVVNAKQYLLQKDVRRLVDAVMNLLELPEQIRTLVYQNMLERFVAFCQHMPLDQKAKDTTFVEARLKRAFATLNYYVPLIRQNQGYGFDQDRLIFALFSAALMHGIGRILQVSVIEQVSADGHYINTWFPNVGLLKSGFYRVRSRMPQSEDYVNAMNVNYAMVILPPEAAAWLMEDQTLYLIWVKALTSFKDGFDVLGADIDLKDEKTLEDVYQLGLEKDELTPDELVEAEKFWAWLKEMVKKTHTESSLKESGISKTQSGVMFDVDHLTEMYAEQVKLREMQKSRLKKSIKHLGVGAISGSSLLVDRERGYLDIDEGVPAVSVTQAQSHIGAPERFFSRVAGVAMQFMQAYTSRHF